MRNHATAASLVVFLVVLTTSSKIHRKTNREIGNGRPDDLITNIQEDQSGDWQTPLPTAGSQQQ